MPTTAASEARVGSVAAVAAVAVYVAVDVALASVRRDYSLLSNAESDYGRGRDAWLMDVNFVLRAALSLVAAWTLVRSGILRRSWPVWLVSVWAVCSGLLAAFADNPPGYPSRRSGSVHLLLAGIAFTAIVVAVVAMTVYLATSPEWRSRRPVLVALSAIGVIAYLVLPRTLGHAHGIGGLVERIFLGSQLGWLVVVMVGIAVDAPG